MEQTLAGISASLAEVTERTGRLAVGIEARPRMGSSGILWKTGVVVTADHAVRREDEIPVVLQDGAVARGRLAGRDPGTDLAVIRVDGAEAVEFERREGLRAGELILAVGRHQPGTLAHFGIVSTAGGAWRTWRGGQVQSLLRLDVSAYPRSSGSVVVDAAGRVAGMLTAGLTRTAPVAIPAATIDRVAAQLLEHGRVARGYLGVGLQQVALPERLASLFNREQATGVMVLSVEPGGAAEAGGVVLGDVIVEVDGSAALDTDDIQTSLEGKAGKELNLIVLRGGGKLGLKVRIGERRA